MIGSRAWSGWDIDSPDFLPVLRKQQSTFLLAGFLGTRKSLNRA